MSTDVVIEQSAAGLGEATEHAAALLRELPNVDDPVLLELLAGAFASLAQVGSIAGALVQRRQIQVLQAPPQVAPSTD